MEKSHIKIPINNLIKNQQTIAMIADKLRLELKSV